MWNWHPGRYWQKLSQPSSAMAMLACSACRVAAQLPIAGDLLARQDVDRGQMVFQMRRAKRALQRCDVLHAAFEARFAHRPARELAVESSLCGDQALAEWYRLGLHGLKELPHLLLLHLAQLQLCRKLEHMPRARIAVELGGEGQAHAASCLQVGNLVLRERLDRPGLETCVRLMRLRPTRRRCEKAGGRRDAQAQVLHRSSWITQLSREAGAVKTKISDRRGHGPARSARRSPPWTRG